MRTWDTIWHSPGQLPLPHCTLNVVNPSPGPRVLYTKHGFFHRELCFWWTLDIMANKICTNASDQRVDKKQRKCPRSFRGSSNNVVGSQSPDSILRSETEVVQHFISSAKLYFLCKVTIS